MRAVCMSLYGLLPRMVEYLNDICNSHAPYRQKKLRQQSLPWITPQIRHTMNLRYKTLLTARQTNDEIHWSEYRLLQNRVTYEIRIAKCEYYSKLFDEVKNCKAYWKLITNAAGSTNKSSIVGIRKQNGVIETCDKAKADILNEFFSSVGENLANELPPIVHDNSYINRITPTVMNITLSNESPHESLKRLKGNKACGPDNVSPKLLKYGASALVPSLMSVFKVSRETNIVPKTWKRAKVSPIFKKDDVTDKQNYRPGAGCTKGG